MLVDVQVFPGSASQRRPAQDSFPAKVFLVQLSGRAGYFLGISKVPETTAITTIHSGIPIIPVNTFNIHVVTPESICGIQLNKYDSYQTCYEKWELYISYAEFVIACFHDGNFM